MSGFLLTVFTSQRKKNEKRKKCLFATLLRINMPILLYTPFRIHGALEKSKVESHILDPSNVIKFLLTSQTENSRCSIAKLPIQLSESNIQNISSLRGVLEYCQEKLEGENLEGLPLLLTADSMLRVFALENPVFCSSFSDLFPDKAFKFVHSEFVSFLLRFGLPDGVIHHLTVESLVAEFMPDVFQRQVCL